MISPSCVHNFYENPDSVRDFALSLDFKPPRINENYPGFRTKCLSKIDIDFPYLSRGVTSCCKPVAPFIIHDNLLLVKLYPIIAAWCLRLRKTISVLFSNIKGCTSFRCRGSSDNCDSE